MTTNSSSRSHRIAEPMAAIMALAMSDLCHPVTLLAADGPGAGGDVSFNRDIRPILADNCFQCHGPDPGSRKANLRLDREDGFFARRDDGPTVVPGKPEASPLYQRVISTDEDEVMPPPKAHKKLTAAQKDLVRKWIAAGAPWQPHWSLIKPQRPALPAVKDAKWVRNPIDRFVLAKLEAAGLQPAPEADKRTLARRLSLDLTGLPPEPALVEAFVADASPDAYEKLVDKLMQSPRFGEHRARYWLDAARYADTHGLHFDNFREIWPYRDWVIDAFNRNQPFDQFTIDQIAGDLLPDATQDQLVATGFHRCAITTNEGGSIAEEVLVSYARERVETTSWVWLGITANCASCHDHKFDPITMKDFYSMAAYFRNTTQNAMDGNIPHTPPVMTVTRAEDRVRAAELGKQIAEIQKQQDARKAAARGLFDTWLATAKPDGHATAVSTESLTLRAALNEGAGKQVSVVIDGKTRQIESDAIVWAAGREGHGKAYSLPAQGAVELPDAGDFDRTQPFTVSAWVKLTGRNQTGAIVARMNKDERYRGWDLWVQQDKVGMHVINQWPDDAVKVVTKKALEFNKWNHVAAVYDGTGKASGIRIFVNGQAEPVDVENDKLRSTTRTKVPLKIGQRHNSERLAKLTLEDLRLYARALQPAEVETLMKSSRVAELLAKAAEQRTPQEKDELFAWWLANHDEPTKQLLANAAALQAEQTNLSSKGVIAYIMQEKPNSIPMAHILFRGEYDKPREKVEAGVFAALHDLPAGAPKNRLGLAQWLVSPENPLTARVTVNRFWQEFFGTGIVKTSEDFGIMGEAPSHPELLDWLAVEFQRAGTSSPPEAEVRNQESGVRQAGAWDVKALIRLIVTSATYRQASVVTPDKIAKDRDNRLLSRGPRFRMDAEMVRDYALAVSGLLSDKIGGPSVKPYQPEGVWEAVAMPESNTRFYKRDTGEALYRRSMYTFWKRAAPPASMDIFNAPSREFSCLRRDRTNTPLQALVTLNDPQFIEAARVLAQHALKSGAKDDAGVIDFVARRLLARPMSEKEVAVVVRIKNDLLAHYKANPAAAGALLAVGEIKADASLDPATLAGWTMVCNQLMNLDEVLNK